MFRSGSHYRQRNYVVFFFFFFNDTATTEIYTLSLHDALPISCCPATFSRPAVPHPCSSSSNPQHRRRSEEHTSELQSRGHLVCRLLLEKKKQHKYRFIASENKT